MKPCSEVVATGLTQAEEAEAMTHPFPELPAGWSLKGLQEYEPIQDEGHEQCSKSEAVPTIKMCSIIKGKVQVA